MANSNNQEEQHPDDSPSRVRARLERVADILAEEGDEELAADLRNEAQEAEEFLTARAVTPAPRGVGTNQVALSQDVLNVMTTCVNALAQLGLSNDQKSEFMAQLSKSLGSDTNTTSAQAPKRKRKADSTPDQSKPKKRPTRAQRGLRPLNQMTDEEKKAEAVKNSIAKDESTYDEAAPSNLTLADQAVWVKNRTKLLLPSGYVRPQTDAHERTHRDRLTHMRDVLNRLLDVCAGKIERKSFKLCPDKLSVSRPKKGKATQQVAEEDGEQDDDETEEEDNEEVGDDDEQEEL
ncbi:hypothetical protein P7C71_g1300, partial [Lecanoromycetidae sp. Uapishka_2]